MTDRSIDRLDGAVLDLLVDDPRIGVLEIARRLRVARGTVQARLDRLRARGVLDGDGSQVDPAALGYPVTAFLSLEIGQGGGRDPVVAHLAAIPEVLEVHTVTGSADLLVRLVARSNDDLQRVIDSVVADPGVLRVSTTIALANPVRFRTRPIIAAAAG